jgi:hypothetical protein
MTSYDAWYREQDFILPSIQFRLKSFQCCKMVYHRQNPAHFSTTLHLDIDMPFLV